MIVLEVENYQQMSEKAANIMFQYVAEGKKAVLGLATGGTPVKTYDLLVSRIQNEKTDLSHVHTVNLDEYIGLDEKHPQSYHHFMEEHLFQHVPIPKKQTHLPNGNAEDLNEECIQYEQIIESLGGVDIQLLGIGANGHIGFNEPGTPFDQKTHLVDLAPSTREANARFFASLDEVPKKAITMGIATIMNSKNILLLASGESKADALKQLIEGSVSEACPATVLQEHPSLTIIADEAALSSLSDEARSKINQSNVSC